MELILASKAKEITDKVNSNSETLEFIMNTIAKNIKEMADKGKYTCRFNIEASIADSIDAWDILKWLTASGYDCQLYSSIATGDVDIDICWKNPRCEEENYGT